MKSEKIQTVLTRSYLAYFLFTLFGLLVDNIVGFSVIIPYANIIAVGCFLVGAILVLWAQNTTALVYTGSEKTKFFGNGPYKFLRNPTHLGMVLLVTGYTAVSGSVIFLGVTVIGYIISNKFFREYELLLIEHFGDDYKKYQREVPKIL